MSLVEAIERIQCMRHSEPPVGDLLGLSDAELESRWVQRETFDRCLGVLQLLAHGITPMQGSRIAKADLRT